MGGNKSNEKGVWNLSLEMRLTLNSFSIFFGLEMLYRKRIGFFFPDS